MAFAWDDRHFVNQMPCLDFANTVVWRHDPARREDRLGQQADLAAWAMAAKLARPDMRLSGAIAMRETIDRYFRSGSKRQDWADLVQLYAESLAENGWDFPRTILHSAFVLALSDEASKVKSCGNCGSLFIDRTRNSNKRWCTAEICGSRTRSQRHYQKLKSAQAF